MYGRLGPEYQELEHVKERERAEEEKKIADEAAAGRSSDERSLLDRIRHWLRIDRRPARSG